MSRSKCPPLSTCTTPEPPGPLESAHQSRNLSNEVVSASQRHTWIDNHGSTIARVCYRNCSFHLDDGYLDRLICFVRCTMPVHGYLQASAFEVIKAMVPDKVLVCGSLQHDQWRLRPVSWRVTYAIPIEVLGGFLLSQGRLSLEP